MNNLLETSNVQSNLLVAFMQWAVEVSAVVCLTTWKRGKMRRVAAAGEICFSRALLFINRLHRFVTCCIRNQIDDPTTTKTVSFF